MPNAREKLIELLSAVSCKGNGESLGSCPDRKYGLCGEVAKLSYCVIQNIANHLIANGATIPVHCKDCTHSDTISCSDGMVWCSRMCRYMKEDGFCSLGERKTDES